MIPSIDIAELLGRGRDQLSEAVMSLAVRVGFDPHQARPALGWRIGGLVVVGLLGLWIASRRGRRRAVAANDLARLTRSPKRLGLGAAGLFVAVFAGWSVFAPLASATLAPGVISPDGHRKTVQHLEGGIIRTIHVREGDKVGSGDPLITLDDTAARSLDSEIRERFLHVLATEARLEAERVGSPEIRFPDALLTDGSAEIGQILDGQRQLVLSRRATHQARTQILEARVLQLEQQTGGLEQVIAAQDQQLALIDEEIEGVQALLDQGLERKPRVLALQRARAEVAASRAANSARFAEVAEAIGETRLELLSLDEERGEAITTELADIRRVLAELRGQLPSREDILQRTVIRSPISGTVMNLRATTEGGVIGPGDPLLDIVPDAAKLVINARVQPNDIERVRPGMQARVVLTAYKQRSLPLIHGTLQSISADALTDERSGLSYFLARVEVGPQDLAALARIQLVPGMPAEVMLLDGEQSLARYLLAPLLESRRRSLVER